MSNGETIKDSETACRAHYRARLEASRTRLAELDRLDERIANMRLAVFIGGGLAGAGFWQQQVWALPLIVVAAVCFLSLMIWHGRVLVRLSEIRICLEYYEHGLARLDGTWHGCGPDGEQFLPDAHLYARDLDVFGSGSLYQLLCRAESSVGRETLAAWLSEPATVLEILRRQEACQELRDKTELRESVAMAGAQLGRRVGSRGLFEWARRPPMQRSWVFRAGLVALSAFTIASGVGLLMSVLSPLWLLNGLLLQYGIGRRYRAEVQEIHGSVFEVHEELLVVKELMALFEEVKAEPNRGLEAFLKRLESEQQKASEAIGNLSRRLDLADAMRNQFFAPFGFVLFWGLHSAFSLENWRKIHGARVQGWFEALGELEALSSLACHSFENPDHVVPLIHAQGQVLRLEGVAHPLLDSHSAVRNDLTLGEDFKLVMISGSNMSGKSTMLRTVGVNLVLAQAGATVRATRMETSVFQIGGTLSIHDSLQLGASRFYAEILRIGALVEVSEGQDNLLFLLDEILHGTNSHDRRIGAMALLDALIARGALGLVSTHDLALTEEIGTFKHARNVHFADRLEGDRLVFDYRLADGVVTRSNAIELMRSVGLPV